MLLSYVCKSVSASDGISPRTEVDTAKTSGPQGTSKLLTRDVYSLPHPKSVLERSLPRPAPAGSLPLLAEKCHPRPVFETLVSVALVTGHDVFAVCVSFQSALVHTQKGVSRPR